MAQVLMPQKQDPIGKASALAGLASGIGRLAGGDPSGALSVAGSAKALQNQPQQSQIVTDTNAIGRRLNQQVPIEEKIATFQQAERALPDLPPEVREEVGPTIMASMVNLAKEIRATGYQPGGQRIG